MQILEMEHRNITIAGKPTTLLLERYYWALLELFAKKNNLTWQNQCLKALQKKPASYKSRAGFLRAWCTMLIYAQLQKALAE